jgi:hypothetical protein
MSFITLTPTTIEEEKKMSDCDAEVGVSRQSGCSQLQPTQQWNGPVRRQRRSKLARAAAVNKVHASMRGDVRITNSRHCFPALFNILFAGALTPRRQRWRR